MKRTHKGFTLVELLIVVAILGALAAIMTVSSGSSIAKAKATAIANNLKTCTTAAQLYYLQSGDVDESGKDIGSITTTQVLALVPNWSDFSVAGSIKYEKSGDEKYKDPFKDNFEISYQEKSIYMLHYLLGDNICVWRGILKK